MGLNPTGRLRRLVLVLAVAAAWPLVAGARYRQSYDAWTHIFFADHYRRDWWGLWEARWYGGFPVVSYPPLVHQLVGLLGFAVGVEAGWAMVLLGTLIALPFAVVAFARRFVGSRPAWYAGLTAPFIPAVSMAAHTFGQLPTLFGLACALTGLAFLADFLRTGRRFQGCRAGLWLTAAAAAHHGTLLFLPWGVAAVCAHRLVGCRDPLPRLVRRLVPWVLATAAGAGLVVWPFWVWNFSQTPQTPIDHLSRHSFLADPAAAGFFFWPMYGPLAALVPPAVRMTLTRRRLGPGLLFGVCFVLGLGGTTPLPAVLFGPGWEWLTYDRFALWAAVALSPVLGLLGGRVSRIRPGWIRWILGAAGGGLLAGSALYAATFASINRTQPPPVDPDPIVAFLSRDDARDWRYVTFGFGDRFARLSLLTAAETIDGNYPTGRPWAVLRASGLGSLDGALWLTGGLERLDGILDYLPGAGVRWAFVNHPAYVPLLEAHGWNRAGLLANGVEVWEHPDPRRPPTSREPGFGLPARVSWGALPLLSLAAAVGACAGPRRRGPGTGEAGVARS
jgi:hypothetical protein